MVELRWKGHAETHRGHKRKANEDSVLVSRSAGLWAVADGMGGHESGDVASKMVTDALAHIDDGQTLADQVDQVEDTLIRVNDDIRDYARQKYGDRIMGSTVVVLMIRERLAVAMWAGDSRCYRIRGSEIEQVTRDHRLVEDLLRKGEITEQMARKHPKRNAITRAVGAHEMLYLDWVILEAQPFDRFVLCSDGLYTDVPEDKVLDVVNTGRLDSAAARLVSAGLETSARDNLSAIVVFGA